VVSVLVIPDGAAQPPRGRPTALEAARTPVLDALAAEGEVVRVVTTPAGLAPGSETGVPTLLGRAPRAPVGRGRVDAAAHDVEVPAGLVAWRADVVRADGTRACEPDARAVAARLPMPAVATGGHRLVLLAGRRPGDRDVLGLRVRVWDDGVAPAGPLPAATTLVCARGAAAGCGALLGADVVVPAGATGDVDTDLAAKARAAVAAIQEGAPRVVVHVGAPDEAAHRRDPGAVIAALERLDAELLGPLRHAVLAAAGVLAVCPDHGTDPATGLHDAAPVPALRWGSGVAAAGPARMTERAAASVRAVAAADLLAPLAVAA
jgi:2,3-bisphosphoglycerate-independent phosphoglycerate mutase